MTGANDDDDAKAVQFEVQSQGGAGGEHLRKNIAYRHRWMIGKVRSLTTQGSVVVLSQTDGEPYEPVSVPAWSEERALTALGIRLVPFDHLYGNVQGYATPRREIAINPVAGLPHKTLFYEIAHVLLKHATDETVTRSLREVEAEGVALLCSGNPRPRRGGLRARLT